MLIMALENHPNCTLIGTQTKGTSGNPKLFTHKTGISYKIPSWIQIRSNGKPLEGIGIPPDIKIPARESIINKKDKVIERAISEFITY